MINLVIDIGNTFTKVALFDNRNIIELNKFERFGISDLKKIISQKKIEWAILSSVNQEVNEVEEFLETNYKYVRFNSTMPAGVINHYSTPQTLGLDRFAAVIGVASMFPQTNCLVIDAGTCITYDFIDKDKNYWGGSISPGLSMRFKSMHTLTGRLPLVAYNSEFENFYGDDTQTAILSGVQQGMIYETLGFINEYASRYSGLQVILCGGDVKFFDTRLKNSIFANSLKTEPHLVLIGLNEVIHQRTND